MTLTELVQLYANLTSNHRNPVTLGDGIRHQPGNLNGRRLLSDVAAWHVMDMLSGVHEPLGSKRLPIGFKTGTSYGHRDAWSIGFDGRHVIGVWVGRADNGPVPGITGMKSAAPILFEAFENLAPQRTPISPAPAGALRESVDQLPASLQSFQTWRPMSHSQPLTATPAPARTKPAWTFACSGQAKRWRGGHR